MKSSRIWITLAGAGLLAVPAAIAEAPSGLLGVWREPTGSVIRVAPCGSNICLELIGLGKEAPSTTDGQNPDPAQRSRPLCGLQIGKGFHLGDPNHAEGGTLYDPKSGKSYQGTIVSDGDSLKLRGYVGMKMFGRTETWTRASAGATSCSRS